MPPRVEKKHSKEYKVREIQKNLVKKARLKKEYLKVLKEEGYSAPEKKASEAKLSFREKRERNAAGNRQKIDEKKELKKLRGQQQREKTLQRQQREQERLKEIKEKERQRGLRSSKVTQRTRSGQPLMGPKIEDLLGKIRADDTYTK
ncbi:LAME_0A07558g1_1 [Lachancea meyersii CBS 8951]|uniref:rRNA-processing protein FYV7 n=1 Tax=Lachancea meyersii CBS 8951 TaxID=1266667 RepID=A0A1G4IQW3_9SACH|nr:LAME_0A07558g1_1 [Lachancea meyersii CBS 8951]